MQDCGLAKTLLVLHCSLERISPCGRLERESRFISTIAQLALYHARRKPDTARYRTRYESALKRAWQFLEVNLDENISLSDLAKVAGMSRFHLLRAFREHQGLPPHTWLMQQRLKQARLLLRQQRSLVGIAAELGFVDQSHFIRRFHVAYGITPGRYVLGIQS